MRAPDGSALATSPFLAGAEVSLADLFFTPMIAYLPAMEEG